MFSLNVLPTDVLCEFYQWPLCVSCCLNYFSLKDQLHNHYRPTAQWGGTKWYQPALAVILSGNQSQASLLFFILSAEACRLLSTHQHQPGMWSLDREKVFPQSVMSSSKLQTEAEAFLDQRLSNVMRKVDKQQEVSCCSLHVWCCFVAVLAPAEALTDNHGDSGILSNLLSLFVIKSGFYCPGSVYGSK